MTIMASTKIYKNFQTSIPSEIRKQFNITHDTIVEWGINDNGEPTVNFRNKVTIDDIIGLVECEPTNSVELKRGAILHAPNKKEFYVDFEKQNKMFKKEILYG